MSLQPCTQLARRRRGRGFTLIELVTVVLIIGITAALATPNIAGQIRERRSRDAAQRVALLYSSARMRAMGRGSAVLVRYRKASGFTVLESIEGTAASSGFAAARASCAAQPGRGCLVNDWANTTTSRQLSALTSPTDISITVHSQTDAAAAQDNMDICFTPLGRSFISFDGVNKGPTLPMVGAATVDVRRQMQGVDEGLLRTVAILPNGMARLGL